MNEITRALVAARGAMDIAVTMLRGGYEREKVIGLLESVAANTPKPPPRRCPSCGASVDEDSATPAGDAS
ncbi:hypothetical protein [Spirillospora sp. NBC_01491]|uniref:hypothetical protein n=1 Tax=Spirillospora sp. NBC_01491 TaxID=2976007 RepID=UPI002E32C674|nr:hypothetical protein [Spirillospora sp. NBC_01491]